MPRLLYNEKNPGSIPRRPTPPPDVPAESTVIPPMSATAAITPIFTHFLPIMYFVLLLTDVLRRDRNRKEYLLVAGIIACCLSMFMEEFVRHYLPIEYSPVLTASWFGLSGITIVGFGLHLFLSLTRSGRKLPNFVHPSLFYLPTVLLLANLVFGDEMASGASFREAGIWKWPVYNTAYYIAMFGSNVFNALYLLILAKGIRDADQPEIRGIFKQLIFGVLVTVFFNLVIGTIDFNGLLPPYPYIYGTLLWCEILRRTMKKYEFLHHVDVRFENLFNVSPVAILLTDMDGNVREANPVAKKLFEALQLDGRTIAPLMQGDLLRRIRNRESIREVPLDIDTGAGRMDLLIDGDYLSLEYVPHMILIVRDVTVEAESRRELARLAYHDALTKLPNRKFFFEELNRALEEAGETGEPFAVMMFDLDLFKDVNDRYGHWTGDRALIRAADAVRAILGPGDFAARFGGDEFIICFRSAATEDAVRAKIGELRKHLAEHPLDAGAERVALDISIGVSFHPKHGEDSDTLLHHADQALYDVKRSGRGREAFAPDPA